jgi:hypothetical protein
MAVPSGQGWGTDVYRAVFYPIRSSDGGIDAPEYPIPANEAFEGYEFLGPKNLSLNLGAPRAVTNVSQGRVNGTIYLPSTDAKTAEFHLSYIDQALFSTLGGVKRRVDIGNGSTMPFGTDKQGLEIDGTFVISNLAFHDENEIAKWHNYILPRVRAVVTMPSFDENAVDVTVNLSLGSTRKHVWGQAVSELLDGATQLIGYDHITNERFNLVAWLADGVEDLFLLPTDKPARSDFADSFAIWNYTTGLEITAGIAKSTTGVDFVVAPDEDTLLIAVYEY